MITELSACPGVLWQIRNWRAGGKGGGGVFAAGDDGGEGARGAVGDGCPDGDLVHVLAVEQFDAESLAEGCLEACGGGGEDVAEQREGVQEGGAGVVAAGPGEFG